MKKERRIHFKMDEAEFANFAAACHAVNEPYSAIIRHLCAAAAKYITTNNLDQWYPPKLVLAPPEIQTNPDFLTYIDGQTRNSVRIKSAEEMARDKSIAKAAEARSPTKPPVNRLDGTTKYPRLKKQRK